MEIINLQTAEQVAPNLRAFRMFSNKKTELIHLQLDKGEILARHPNPNDVVFYVLERSCELWVNNELETLSKDSCTAVGAGLDREWRNIGNGVLKILVVKLFE